MNENDVKNSIVRIEVEFYNSEKAKLVTSNGTGFFIEKNKILTCYHIIENHEKEEDIKVFLPNQTTPYQVSILDKNKENDLALLQIESDNEYFVQTNDKVINGDNCYCHGFPEIDENNEKLKEIIDRPLTLEAEGTDTNNQIIQFKNGQVKSGFSGSPILNLSTGAVCGIICISRNTSNYLGGYGIPIAKRKLLEGMVIPKPIQVKPRTILFNNYTAKSEPYYLEREEDVTFIKTLELSNIWIFGKSGKGKTALIQRNLIQADIKYVFCDLSSITIESTENIFDDIIATIEETFEISKIENEDNRVKIIVKLLEEIALTQIVIVIDEMSVDDTTLLKEIGNCFLKLVTYYTNTYGDESLKFVISTKAEPQEIILNKAKASNYFEYICCDNWEGYLSSLFDLLNYELGLNFLEEVKNYILSQSDDSPRILNKVFLKLIICDDLDDEKIINIVKLAVEESI